MRVHDLNNKLSASKSISVNNISRKSRVVKEVRNHPRGQYVVVNTSPTKIDFQDIRERIKDAHGKVSCYSFILLLKILDENKRVKFESEDLKYDLRELFDNVPAFDEPIPMYHLMNDYLP